MRFRRLPLVVAAAAALTVLSSTAALASTVGYDVSYPQCAVELPADAAFGIVGVSDGAAYGENPCLASQYGWAAQATARPGFYMNTGNPGPAARRASWYDPTSPPMACGPDAEAGCAYDYGYNDARRAYDYATSQVGRRPVQRATWWLDVETANSWSADTALNLAAIEGAVDFLSARVAGVGIYSTGYQWAVITGGAWLPWLPNWVAGAGDPDSAAALCRASFTGGPVELVQYGLGGLDADYAC
ncbi:MAG TPA: hypothetical protein VL337_12280 [Acidimicrobiales bacterium]|jgi:hypothetical protein|nr:hypothetical protein [Acidimicrobiales bacterium]